MNPPQRRKCKVKKEHFATSRQAHRRMEEIALAPLEPGRMYAPNGVLFCTCGQFVLTSSSPKPNRKGKTRRNRRVRTIRK